MSATSKDQLSSDIHPQVLSPTLDKTDDAAKTTELAVDDKIRRARDDFSRQSGMPLREGLGVYRSAVWWSALMTLTVVMEAYDYGLMGNLYGFPSFAQKFGQRLPSGMYNISAADQSILKQITKAGQLIGLFFTGWLVDRFGYKWTMLGSLLLLVPVVAYQYFAPNIGALIGAQFLLGVPLAPFLTLSNVYAAEVAPLCLQPYLTSATSLAWTVGGFISAGVLRGLLNSGITDSYKIAFAVQWVWIAPIFVICYLAPESPMWCVKSGRPERARIALKRLSSDNETDEQIENRLALLEYTDQLERHYNESTSYLELFRGVNLRRTEIAIMVYSSTNLDGYDIGTASNYFFQQAGLDAASAFNLTLGNYAISIVACCVCWWFMGKFGKRPLYMFGLAASVVMLIGIGGLGIPAPSTGTAWGTGGLCFLFGIVFKSTQGPLTYAYITDVPSVRLRSKTVVVARAAFLFSAVFMVVLTNYQINATAWNRRGKAGFFWAGSCFLVTLWAYFRLPETKNRSPAELDRLFMDGVSARKFRTTFVEAIQDDDHVEARPQEKA